MDKTKSEEILNTLCQEIGGEWLLVGGTLVQLAFDGERSTEDIDLVSISHPDKSREFIQNELFKHIQKKWGMGPEHVNLSVEFFVRDLKDWETETRVFREGRAGKVFAPTLTLFLALKIRRGSPLDRRDIQTALKSSASESINWPILESWLTEDQKLDLKKILK